MPKAYGTADVGRQVTRIRVVSHIETPTTELCNKVWQRSRFSRADDMLRYLAWAAKN